MRYVTSEWVQNYDHYSFGYCIYGIAEERQDITKLYTQGFLPYTGHWPLEELIFYKARSLRLDLNNLKDLSENRRMQRLADKEHLQLNIHPYRKLSEAHRRIAYQYIDERIGRENMPEERFNSVIKSPLVTHLAEVRRENELWGWVILCLHGREAHYWFSFFNTDFMDIMPIGKWMMYRCAEKLKSDAYKWMYTGTCYGKSGLYKVRDFEPLQWHEGNRWSEDVSTLKQSCKNERSLNNLDAFKTKLIHGG